MSKPKCVVELEKTESVRIKVVIDGDIAKYASSFLAIYNNYKSNSELLKVYNDYDNGVYLVCTKSAQEAAVEFLEQFGTIVSVVDIEAVRPVVYDYDYKDDIDVEFLEPEE